MFDVFKLVFIAADGNAGLETVSNQKKQKRRPHLGVFQIFLRFLITGTRSTRPILELYMIFFFPSVYIISVFICPLQFPCCYIFFLRAFSYTSVRFEFYICICIFWFCALFSFVSVFCVCLCCSGYCSLYSVYLNLL